MAVIVAAGTASATRARWPLALQRQVLLESPAGPRRWSDFDSRPAAAPRTSRPDRHQPVRESPAANARSPAANGGSLRTPRRFRLRAPPGDGKGSMPAAMVPLVFRAPTGIAAMDSCVVVGGGGGWLARIRAHCDCQHDGCAGQPQRSRQRGRHDGRLVANLWEVTAVQASILGRALAAATRSRAKVSAAQSNDGKSAPVGRGKRRKGSRTVPVGGPSSFGERRWDRRGPAGPARRRALAQGHVQLEFSVVVIDDRCRVFAAARANERQTVEDFDRQSLAVGFSASLRRRPPGRPAPPARQCRSGRSGHACGQRPRPPRSAPGSEFESRAGSAIRARAAEALIRAGATQIAERPESDRIQVGASAENTKRIGTRVTAAAKGAPLRPRITLGENGNTLAPSQPEKGRSDTPACCSANSGRWSMAIAANSPAESDRAPPAWAPPASFGCSRVEGFKLSSCTSGRGSDHRPLAPTGRFRGWPARWPHARRRRLLPPHFGIRPGQPGDLAGLVAKHNSPLALRPQQLAVGDRHVQQHLIWHTARLPKRLASTRCCETR